jgi:hypothetical protein
MPRTKRGRHNQRHRMFPSWMKAAVQPENWGCGVETDGVGCPRCSQQKSLRRRLPRNPGRHEDGARSRRTSGQRSRRHQPSTRSGQTWLRTRQVTGERAPWSPLPVPVSPRSCTPTMPGVPHGRGRGRSPRCAPASRAMRARWCHGGAVGVPVRGVGISISSPGRSIR